MISRLKSILKVLVIIALLMTSLLRNAVWHDGIMLWSDVIKKSPNERRAYSNLCTYYSAEQNFVAGFKMCGKALSFDPQVRDKYLVNTYINRGALYSDHGDFALAIQDYQNALALDPTNARIYNNIGNIYIMQGNFSDAQESFARAISINPKYALAYLNRGSLNRRTRNSDKAIDDFSMTILLSPENSKAYVQRGLTYYDLKQTDKAATDFNTACKLGNMDGCRFSTNMSK